jgi:hypothetical protein
MKKLILKKKELRMRADYKRDLKQYLIDLDEKFFCEYDDAELMQTTVTRKHIEKNLPLFTSKELYQTDL